MSMEQEAEPQETNENEYRRRRAPVPVRRRAWTRYWHRGWKPALIAAIAVAAGAGIYNFVFASPWFVLQGSDQIAVVGAHRVDTSRVLEAFSADLGRNTFFIPLAARRRAVEQIPWVQQAAVLHLWPARLEVEITERTPVAYARVGNQLDLIDRHGVLLMSPQHSQYAFPVLTGLAGAGARNPNSARWLGERQAQVSQWLEFQRDTAAAGRPASSEISEVNVSDPDNLQVRVSLSGSGSVLVDLGNRNFGPRFQLFLSQIATWRQKYPNIVSVDLRFDGQAIVDPGTASPPAARP